jgi:7-cyano-7-deazaguanine synthase in queuosine biosynthesis
LIVADTKNPDDYLSQEGPERIPSNNKILMQPLLNHDKRTTLLLAQDMKVLDKVSEISHTCTESKTLRCTLCWQCLERAWAFSKLGLTDMGNM